MGNSLTNGRVVWRKTIVNARALFMVDQCHRFMVSEARMEKSTPKGHTLSHPETPNAHTPHEGRRGRWLIIHREFALWIVRAAVEAAVTSMAKNQLSATPWADAVLNLVLADSRI